MPSIDVPAIRHQFPALSITDAGRPVAYFDGPGGTQAPNRVIDAMTRYFRTMNANHGGRFLTSQRSDAMLERAHEAVADLLNAAPRAICDAALEQIRRDDPRTGEELSVQRPKRGLFVASRLRNSQSRTNRMF